MKACVLKIVSLIILSSSALFAQQVSLVKDINSSANNNGSNPYYTIAFGSSVVFVANDPLTGSELWISNGSSAGTTLIKDIYPGGYSSSISGLVNIGGTIYFSANDGVNGRELWKTNGTPAGTVMVKDINPGPGSSSPSLFTLFSGFIYFRATTDAAGSELWKTDGTTANTVLVEDINPGNGGSSPSEFTALGNTFLIFRASTPTNGSELYSYNGGTLNFLDIVAGAGGSNPAEIKYNSTLGTVFFRAYNATSGWELWKTNGNFSTGTSVIDIEVGTGSSYPYFITSQGGFVYFNGYKSTTGYELYRSNGTTTGLVGTELYAGTGSSSPYYLTPTGGGGVFFYAFDGVNTAIRYTTGTSISTIANTTGIFVDQIIANPSSANIYFSAYTSTSGYELWTANSTTASLIKDIVPGSGNSYPYYLAFTGSIFFSADNGTVGNELWVSDGTSANTVLVKDINSATDSNIYSSIATSTGFLISANDGLTGQELWKTDGTSLGTVLIEDILAGVGGSNPDFLGRIGTTYFFSAYDNVNGTEIWKSDGATTGGTLLLADINPGIDGSYPYGGVVMGSFLYFVAYTSANGYELWKTNGTTTSLVQDIYPGNFSSYPSYLTVVGTTLFFTAEDATNGNEVWKSDGITASMVKNINLSGSSYPYNLANVNGKLYFSADDGVTGYELWASDGTSAGTTSPKDINSGIGASYPYNITALGSTAYFVADDGTNGTELWKSDGTLAGTVLVKDIYTGAGNSSYPSYLTVANSRLYFTAYEPTTGTEIYKSDGTSANTGLLKDIRSGSGSSNAYNLTNLNETIYFSASDGTSGNLLYKSNGATAFPASSAGVQYDQPGVIRYYNGKLLFTANTNSFGNEPLTVMAEPLNQPTALIFTARTGTSISASFTAAAGSPAAPSGYIVLRKTGSAPTDLPVDGTTYTVGTAIGTSTVAAIGAGNTFTDTFTGSATPPVYYYAVYSYNNDGTANIYRAISPLQGNATPLALEPTAQPTAFNKSSVTTTSFTVSFTAAAGPPTGYIVLRKAGAVAPTEVPVDGTAYTAGNPLGTSTVAYIGTAATFPQTGLTANTSYSYSIFSYNGIAGTFNYLTTGPLTGTVSTLVAAPTAQPTALVFSNVGAQSLTGNFTAATGTPAGYLVIRKKDSAPTGTPAGGVAYAVGDALGDATVAYVGSATTFNDTGLLGESTYHYSIFAFNGSGITTNYLTTAPLANSQLTLANEPASQPTALVFSNITTSSYTVSFTAAAGPPTGYLAVRKNGSSPTGVPQDGTIYTVGTPLGDGTIAFVGAGVTFNETLAIAPYAYDVFAYNGSTGTINYLVTNPLQNILSLDNTPPIITNETPLSISSPTTTQLKIVASITENESSISAGSVKVEYRSISSGSTFSAPQDMVLNAGKWEFSVPASANGEMGVEYKITATNSQNLSSSVTSKANLSFSDAAGLLIPYTAFGSDVSNYRIIGIPLELSSKSVTSVLVDDLTASDKKNWRLFRHENSSNQNIEMSPSSTIDAGKGYWLIVKESKTMDTGPGTTVAATLSEPYTINLSTGWNLIGNPYHFNVLWSDVKTASGVAGTLDLVTYDGSYNESDSKLDKFEGGFVFTSSALALKFPVTKNPSAGGRESIIAKTKNLNAIDQPNWEVTLKLRNGDKVSGFGGIGMNENANRLEDEYDGFTLPRFLEYMEVNHTKRFHDIAYTKDIVPSSQNHEWEFTVETNLNGNTELSWDNSYFGNNDNAALKLWDVEEQRAVDMKKVNSYSLNGKASKSFRIFYGNKEFVNGKTELKSLMVHSVSPNPTNGQSNISFSLPGEEEALVQVRVLNMLGQPIASVYNGMLTGGYNEVTWNGKDNSDTKPPQGIYLVEIQSNNQTRVVKLVVN